ncbi:uncharacterized protein LOC114327822 [Diabrotica virgifera virgifera]|uniref:Uncharacterized protein LOC114327822 n=1 Tax=Diabrotica virgifera virgifera TaxID=50390 RepID=A0A6P7F9V7_DIAVI|nr:uncharacterized protein LOC114327822 [Diabrotica virgifera virgifera]
MKTVFGASVLVICLSAVYGLVDVKEFSPKLLALTKSLHTTCLAQSGCNEAQIALMKAGNLKNPTVSEKKYVSCLWTSSGLLNSKLETNRALLEELMPASIASTETPIYLTCIEETKKQVQLTVLDDQCWFLMNCIHDASPGNFIMF